PLHVSDEQFTETEHHFSVALIATPDEVITCDPPRRPSGLYWNNLSPAKIKAIPLLAARAAAARRGCRRAPRGSGGLGQMRGTDPGHPLQGGVVGRGKAAQAPFPGADAGGAEAFLGRLR